MEIIVAKNSGFCPGVKKAVDTAFSYAGKNACVYGELIHNDKVIEELKSKDIETINDLSEANDRTVLIRAHGVGEEFYKKADELNLKIVDLTCPFVIKIHEIVKIYYNKGYKIVILGKPDHPEVAGTNGWCCDTALITDNFDKIAKLPDKNLCIVAQTTFSNEKYEEISKKIKTLSDKKVEIFKTICYTTMVRQEEVKNLAGSVDAVIVIGGAKSSNTRKLYEIAAGYNPNVFLISDSSGLNKEKIKKYRKVGIVLGASTPESQLQEVIQTMENTEVNVTPEVNTTPETATETVEETAAKEVNEAKKYTMDEEMKKLEKKPRQFRIGQVITAKISSATDEGLAVYIPNTKKEIFVDKNELILDYKKEDYADKIDHEIRLMVTKLNPVVLSEKAMVNVLKEEAEIKEIESGKVFEAEVKEVNKGGLIAKYGSYNVFIPSSQIRIGYVKDLDKYIGKTLRLKAEKVETRRHQIVASQRVILEAEKAEREAIRKEKIEAFFNTIQLGDVVIGTPVRFAEFGAFVSVNGFDCLAHISDLSWTGCTNPADVLELNKEYEFKILKIDAEKQKVSIGYKQLQPRPWQLVEGKYHVGDVIHGKVVRIVSFGAFVEVEKGVDGLVHVSQISNKWLDNPLSALEVGQEVDAKILGIDLDKEKMTLSIKALLPEEPKKESAKSVSVKNERKDEEPELKEWRDNEGTGSISIAEIIGKTDK